jgi:hypothetical protein
VSAFGSLAHIRPDAKPAAAGAATRCGDCAHECACAYSAKKSACCLSLHRRASDDALGAQSTLSPSRAA